METPRPTMETWKEVAAAPEVAIDTDNTTTTELQELVLLPTPQIELPAVKLGKPISHEPTVEQDQQHNEDIENISALTALPESPLLPMGELIQEYTIVEKLQLDSTVTPAQKFKDIQEYIASRFTPSSTSAQPEEPTPGGLETTISRSGLKGPDKSISVLALSEVDYISHECVEPEITAERLGPDYAPYSVTQEPVPSGTSETAEDATMPRDRTMDRSEDVVESKAQQEPVPVRPSSSDGPKKKSKKARQREARRRRSLQGIDIPGSSAVAAEMVPTPSIAEEHTRVNNAISKNLTE